MLRGLCLGGCAFAGGALVTAAANATNQNQEPLHLIRQLAEVLVLVENEYVDAVDRDRLLEGAVKGMVAELDPHSSYLPPNEYAVFQADTNGEFGGVGIEVDFRNDNVTVIAPIEGSPAARAGVRPGDMIMAIDRSSVRGKSPAELVRRMRGKAGSTVVITVRRPGRDRQLEFSLERELIEVSSVVGKSLDANIGYLRIKQFQKGTHAELLQAIALLRAEQRIDGVILDVRNNPGGLVDEATGVAGEFLESGVVYSTRHRGRIVDEIMASGSAALGEPPVVVLVNEYSASAAELVAGALQDRKRATIVGAQTFGKGSVQTIVDMPGGAGLRLTTMRYYTPLGHAIQATGIRPDVLVEAAYVPDTSFGVIREEDLDHHLAAESLPAKREPAKASLKPPKQELEQTGISPTHLGVARVIPRDPTGGADFALSIGYQIVRGVLKQSP